LESLSPPLLPTGALLLNPTGGLVLTTCGIRRHGLMDFQKMLPPSTFDRRTSLGESRVRAVVALTYNVVETVPLAYRMAPLTCHTSVRTSLSGQSHTLSPFKSQSLIMRLRTTHIKESLYDLQSKILSCYICGVEQFVDMEWTRLCYVVSSFE